MSVAFVRFVAPHPSRRLVDIPRFLSVSTAAATLCPYVTIAYTPREAIERALHAQGTPLETLPDDAPLFAISSHGFYKNLKHYAAWAGLKDVTPHVLRHAAAKLRRDTGASIEAVGAFLGHRSLHTTSRYLARLEGEHDPGWKGVADALGMNRSR